MRTFGNQFLVLVPEFCWVTHKKGFVCDSANLFCVWLSKIQALELRTGSQKCTCKQAISQLHFSSEQWNSISHKQFYLFLLDSKQAELPKISSSLKPTSWSEVLLLPKKAFQNSFQQAKERDIQSGTYWIFRVYDNWPRQTDREQTDREPNDANWLRSAIVKIFYYPQIHLAQTLTLWRNQRRNHCDKTIGSRSVCSRSVWRGQLTWLGIFLRQIQLKEWDQSSYQWRKTN